MLAIEYRRHEKIIIFIDLGSIMVKLTSKSLWAQDIVWMYALGCWGAHREKPEFHLVCLLQSLFTLFFETVSHRTWLTHLVTPSDQWAPGSLPSLPHPCCVCAYRCVLCCHAWLSCGCWISELRSSGLHGTQATNWSISLDCSRLCHPQTFANVSL